MTKKGISDYLGKVWKNFNAPRSSSDSRARENFMRENRIRENFEPTKEGGYRRVNNLQPTYLKNRKK